MRRIKAFFVDILLRLYGYDPGKVGRRMQNAANEAISAELKGRQL